MIGFYYHILHAVDKGTQVIEDSLYMKKWAVNGGTYTIVPTPHHINDQYINKKGIIQRVEK
ncbi:CpsB/CapC family capsule biosynthesis tyrosine phosphatase [Priestia megaterium]|uniref:CpsB/CapC family capsule biosynthesis tyrosine phosphatase n=1 Tax=Priestia megaterium TaxID=1404 RepID=UPI000BFC677D|nr:CpsB/CapC family capsule biosynthesis tyrosine phosphatase [Priestia megaterium]MCM3018690.1 hypothetical protein [Priestia megaterium]PGY51853.1 hypothetical protein COE35_15350 [Priestia megaterium]